MASLKLTVTLNTEEPRLSELLRRHPISSDV